MAASTATTPAPDPTLLLRMAQRLSSEAVGARRLFTALGTSLGSIAYLTAAEHCREAEELAADAAAAWRSTQPATAEQRQDIIRKANSQYVTSYAEKQLVLRPLENPDLTMQQAADHLADWTRELGLRALEVNPGLATSLAVVGEAIPLTALSA